MSKLMCALVLTLSVSACLAQQRRVTDRSIDLTDGVKITGTVTLLNTGILLVKTGGEWYWEGEKLLLTASHTVAYDFSGVEGLSLVYSDGKYSFDVNGKSLEEIQSKMQRSLSVTPLDRVDDGGSAYSVMTVEGEIETVDDGDVTELSVVADGATIASFTFVSQPKTSELQYGGPEAAATNTASCSAGPCGNPNTGTTCNQTCNRDEACISYCDGIHAVCKCTPIPKDSLLLP